MAGMSRNSEGIATGGFKKVMTDQKRSKSVPILERKINDVIELDSCFKVLRRILRFFKIDKFAFYKR